uniref:Rac GTPase-activating protein 1 n=1 Tax=Plectus sambesii TaxID=2011161 RepID=A0A914XV53_9BILA
MQEDPSCSVESKRLLFLLRELTHYWRELGRGQEQECLALVDLLDKTRQKWLTAHSENEGMRQLLKANEDEMEALRVKHKLTTEQLKDARAQIASLLSAKQSAEADLAEFERKFDVVRDLLKDEMAHLPKENQRQLAFLNDDRRRLGVRANAQSFEVVDDEMDYDKTGDSMDDDASFLHARQAPQNLKPNTMKNLKRSRSKSVREAANTDEKVLEGLRCTRKKRSKAEEGTTHEMITTTTTIAVDPTGQRPSRALVSVGRALNRSFSEPRDIGALAAKSPAYDRQNEVFDDVFTPTPTSSARQYAAAGALTPGRYQATGSISDLRSPAVASTLRSWTSGTAIERRPHFFSQKTTLLREYCDVCAKRIGFGSSTLKCADCRLTCHDQCREKAPLPCVPRQGTPKTPKTPSNQRPRLLEFCPTRPPMIPHIAIHCVVELERRGLDFVGIYRIPGSERQVGDVMQKFKSMRGVPNLRELDTEVITGCIKKFLMDLREPLIPSTSWREFVDAAEHKTSDEKLYHAIADLPMPNRDTLAYLCAHWQNVAEQSTLNKMPLENLARILGPTVVGFSSSSTTDMAQAEEETRKQWTVMLALLSLPHEYWTRYFTFDDNFPLLSNGVNKQLEPFSPFSPELGERSLLGPVARTPRNVPVVSKYAEGGSTLKRDGKKQFFAQPWTNK